MAREFCDRHNLDEETEERLEALLNQQISTVLTKIQEEDQQINENDDEEERMRLQYGDEQEDDGDSDYDN